MVNSKFDKIKNKGALDIVDSSVEENEKYVADTKPNIEKPVAKDEEARLLRSYSLTKKQLKLLQEKKLDEIGLTLSDIVGKAIEAYCKK